MKNKYSLMKKITGWTAFIILAFALAASVMILLIDLDWNIYSETEPDYANSNRFEEHSYNYCYYIEESFIKGTLEDSNFMDENNALLFTIYKDGEIVLSNVNGEYLTTNLSSTVFIDSQAYTIEYYINNEVDNIFITYADYYSFLFATRYWNIAALAIELIGVLLTIICLCTLAGHNGENGEIRLSALDKLPLEIVLAVFIVIGIVLPCWMAADLLYDVFAGLIYDIGLVLLFVYMACCCMMMLVSCIDRYKNGVLIKNTITYHILMLIWRFLKMIWQMITELSLMKKTIAFYLLFGAVFPLFALWGRNFVLLVIWYIALVFIYFAYMIGLKRLAEGAEDIAQGKLVAINTEGMSPEQKKAANNINSVSVGIQKAVDERMKAEHFKTELITNVSHDIKTPLTSIINYVDLLQKPHDQQQQEEYLEILQRQANRLKKLTEDIVEVSKASTGNIQVELRSMDGNTLLQQAVGEYEEIFADNDLELVVNYTSKPANVYIDGNLCWRILDNCLNNIKKYAAKNTRVYIDSDTDEEFFIITMRNISWQQLNITKDELMERFVQGDVSRYTDGSGLGLSIAKSLAELQNGQFEIQIDGDLFKAIIRLPLEN